MQLHARLLFLLLLLIPSSHTEEEESCAAAGGDDGGCDGGGPNYRAAVVEYGPPAMANGTSKDYLRKVMKEYEVIIRRAKRHVSAWGNSHHKGRVSHCGAVHRERTSWCSPSMVWPLPGCWRGRRTRGRSSGSSRRSPRRDSGRRTRGSDRCATESLTAKKKFAENRHKLISGARSIPERRRRRQLRLRCGRDAAEGEVQPDRAGLQP